MKPDTPRAPGPAPGARLTRIEHSWRAFTRLAATLRNTALGNLGFALVAIVAGAGWYLSYHNLHGYAVDAMGFTTGNAWLVPVVFDGAPLGLSIVVYRARLQARAALVWRAGIWAFAALSAWVNWLHVPSIDYADALAALLPLAAVVLFEGLMAETHKAAQADLHGGAVVPRLTLACWLLDRRRTFHAFRVKALRPLAAAEDALGIPRAEPVPSRIDVDLEAIGRALAAEQNTDTAAYSQRANGSHIFPYTNANSAAYTPLADGRTYGDPRTTEPGGDARTPDRTNTPDGNPAKGRTADRTATASRRRTTRRAQPDVSDLIPYGQQVYRELHEAGEHLTRDRLASEIRNRGHSLGAARAHALWRALNNGHVPTFD